MRCARRQGRTARQPTVQWRKKRLLVCRRRAGRRIGGRMSPCVQRAHSTRVAPIRAALHARIAAIDAPLQCIHPLPSARRRATSERGRGSSRRGPRPVAKSARLPGKEWWRAIELVDLQQASRGRPLHSRSLSRAPISRSCQRVLETHGSGSCLSLLDFQQKCGASQHPVPRVLCAGQLHGDDKVGRDAGRRQRPCPRDRLVHRAQVRRARRPVVHLGQEENGGQGLRSGRERVSAMHAAAGHRHRRTECISLGRASAMIRRSSSQRAHSRCRPVTTTPSSGTAARSDSGSCEAGLTNEPAPPKLPAPTHNDSVRQQPRKTGTHCPVQA